MARLWTTGFELNSTTNDVENHRHSGGIAIQSTTKRTGTYAAQMTSLSSGTKMGISFRIVGGAASGPYYARIYFRVGTLPSASNTIFTFNGGNNPTTTILACITLESDGTLKLWNGSNSTGATVGSASSALSTDTWYMIDMQYDATAGGGSQVLRARLDGSEFAGASNLTLGGAGQVFSVGANMNAETQTTGNWYFDDIAINDNTGSFQTSYPGAGSVLVLRPNAAGDNTAWTPQAIPNYGEVDEVSPDDSTSFNYSNTNNQIDDYNVEASGLSSEVINVVHVGVRFNANGASSNASFVTRIKASSGGTTEESSTITPSSTSYTTNATSDPRYYPLTLYDLPGASTTAWTPSDLDQAQIGVRLTTSNTNLSRVSTLWMVVDYGAAAGSASASLSPSASQSPSSSQSASLSPSASLSQSQSQSPSASASASLSPSQSPSGSQSPSASASRSASASQSPSRSASASLSPSASQSPSASTSPSSSASTEEVNSSGATELLMGVGGGSFFFDSDFLFGSAISTNAPHYTTSAHPLSVPSIMSELSAPYPTNIWWTNLFMGTNRIVPEPYHIKPVDQGLYICIPSRTVTSGAITTAFLQNIGIEASETISTRKISGYDDLSVSYRWEVDSNNKMTSTFVQGAIFNTVEFTSLTPKITTQHAITSVNGDSSFPDTASGTKFKVTLNNGQTYIIYTESSITFDIQNSGGWRMLADAEYTGWIKIAYLADSGDETELDNYKTIHPTGGTVNATINGNNATITFNFTTDGTGTLAMLALPHHLDLISNTESGITYQTMKGVGTVVEGTTWSMTEPLTTITWDAPRSIESGKVAAIQTALNTDESYTSGTPNDPYFGGKEYAKLGRLITLAENSQINDPTAATTLRASAKTALEPWLNGSNTNAIKYDTTWKGICTTNGLASSSNDFGAGYYNDHHFHWGYHILAAACIARNDASWLASYEDKVNVYVRDIMNPSDSDPYFHKFRHFDWYHGHSWAAGLFDFGDPKNQESTSEAVMAWYGCMLWGIASGNDNIKEHARILLAMEIRSAQKYWHRYTGNDQYEAGMTGNGIGIVWSSKVDDTTFFGGDIEYRRGIQIIPILPITEQLVSSAWASEFYPNEIAGTLGTIDQSWLNFMFAAQATYDKTSAQTNADTLSAYDGGNSKTNQLYWHATRP